MKSEDKKMTDFIIGFIFLILLGIVAIPCMISDYITKIKAERRNNRKKFLMTHPNYAEDSHGNLYKIK